MRPVQPEMRRIQMNELSRFCEGSVHWLLLPFAHLIIEKLGPSFLSAASVQWQLYFPLEMEK